MEYEIKCTSCKRFLGVTNKSTEVKIKCSNSSCKKMQNYKITFMTDMMSSEHNHVHKTSKSDTE